MLRILGKISSQYVLQKIRIQSHHMCPQANNIVSVAKSLAGYIRLLDYLLCSITLENLHIQLNPGLQPLMK